MGTRRALFLGLTAVLAAGFALGGQAIPNWSVPPTWTPAQNGSGGTGMTDLSGPLPFIPITPCRIADTRGLGWTGQAGPPSLTANVTRNFQIAGTVTGVPAQCGIPSGAQAVSFNFAVTNITANGNLIAFPAGGTPPTVSSLNWQTGFAALSNAAIIPLGGGGLGVRVNAAGSTTVDLIIDVNGYYGSSGANPGTTFVWTNNANGASIMTENFSPTCTGPCGVWAVVDTTAGGTAVLGHALGASGANVGVRGSTASPDFETAGVLGFERARPLSPGNYLPAGVPGGIKGR